MAGEIARARRAAFLYRRLYAQSLKAALEYKADFWILTIAAMVMQAVGFVFIWALFRQIPDINGWGMWDIVLMYAMIYFTEGVASLFFEGTWAIPQLVNRGELDQLLSRPVSPVVQVLARGAGLNGVGNVVLGATLIVMALRHNASDLSPVRAALAFVILVSAVVIRVAINLAANSIAFWTVGARDEYPVMIHALGDFGKYPLTIYPEALRVVVVAVVPFAFVGFFPAAFVAGDADWAWAGLLTPLVAVCSAAVALRIFRRGLARYESAGS